jgi:hypothetical protein
MLFEPFGLEYRKDALRAIRLGVSKGCSSSLLAWSIEKILFEPFGLEYRKDALQAIWLGVSKGYFCLEKYLFISSATDTGSFASPAGRT